MKNVKLLVPEGLTLSALPELAQSGIRKVFGQFVELMPGTVPFDGLQVVDAVTDNSFDPAFMSDYGIDWKVIFIGRVDVVPAEEWYEIIVPLDVAEYAKFLPEPEEGPKIIRMTHGFSGWPPVPIPA